VADKMLTMAKEGTLAARRRAGAVVRTDSVLQKLFTEFDVRHKERDGRYTRVLKTQQRTSDSAKMACIEYVDRAGSADRCCPSRLRCVS
jgi:large subunit ribosomal protein L17